MKERYYYDFTIDFKQFLKDNQTFESFINNMDDLSHSKHTPSRALENVYRVLPYEYDIESGLVCFLMDSDLDYEIKTDAGKLMLYNDFIKGLTINDHIIKFFNECFATYNSFEEDES